MPDVELRLWARRASAATTIQKCGIKAKFFTDAVMAATDASLIILCTPIEVMPKLSRQIVTAKLGSDCLVTDVGSVKASVHRELKPIFNNRFIGSHPMAGSEKTGVEVARADLFRQKVCIITPVPPYSKRGLARLKKFWKQIGCVTRELSPEDHDQKVARISHLPHMMAAVTSLSALSGDEQALNFASTGFTDTTRVASGSPEMWAGIAANNQKELIKSLESASTELGKLINFIKSEDMVNVQQFLDRAKRLREAKVRWKSL